MNPLTEKGLTQSVHGRGSGLSLPSRNKRSLWLVLAIVAVIAAIWSSLLLTAPHAQTLDQQVHDVASQLKCPICQGETVADAPVLLAQQMRSVIRQQLQEGKSKSDVIQFFANRYGEQIVLSPPWQGFTLLAWLVPIALLLAGLLLLLFTLRSWHTTSSSALAEPDYKESLHGEESELASFRKQVEQELAADDPLFQRYGMEGR